ncbi:hypothetical protein G3N58_26385 [Paraburkholderia sp. Ac-20342]|uniref:hypothetical protein n=1 Tax=Paraburkholderia sp. Ac-20342 TaxID=2703889 RepID=UPI0019814F1F|nr:hypothetical protein [Paraburkholderia sp. Ac-20342]MBN3850321.1 hypothetical protein [Paraburkholderia sp. Ac-20342]
MKIVRVLLAAVLSGCAIQQPVQLPSAPIVPTTIVDKGCEWVKFITASADDTEATKRQIIAHDQAFVANCPDAAPGSD